MAGEVCRAPNCGPARDPLNPEMVEGGSTAGRRGMGGDRGGDATRGSDLAAVGEPLPASCFRYLGEAVAAEGGERGHDYGPLRRRCRIGVRAPEGSGSVPRAVAGADAEVRAGTTPGEDETD